MTDEGPFASEEKGSSADDSWVNSVPQSVKSIPREQHPQNLAHEEEGVATTATPSANTRQVPSKYVTRKAQQLRRQALALPPTDLRNCSAYHWFKRKVDSTYAQTQRNQIYIAQQRAARAAQIQRLAESEATKGTQPVVMLSYKDAAENILRSIPIMPKPSTIPLAFSKNIVCHVFDGFGYTVTVVNLTIHHDTHLAKYISDIQAEIDLWLKKNESRNEFIIHAIQLRFNTEEADKQYPLLEGGFTPVSLNDGSKGAHHVNWKLGDGDMIKYWNAFRTMFMKGAQSPDDRPIFNVFTVYYAPNNGLRKVFGTGHRFNYDTDEKEFRHEDVGSNHPEMSQQAGESSKAASHKSSGSMMQQDLVKTAREASFYATSPTMPKGQTAAAGLPAARSARRVEAGLRAKEVAQVAVVRRTGSITIERARAELWPKDDSRPQEETGSQEHLGDQVVHCKFNGVSHSQFVPYKKPTNDDPNKNWARYQRMGGSPDLWAACPLDSSKFDRKNILAGVERAKKRDENGGRDEDDETETVTGNTPSVDRKGKGKESDAKPSKPSKPSYQRSETYETGNYNDNWQAMNPKLAYQREMMENTVEFSDGDDRFFFPGHDNPGPPPQHANTMANYTKEATGRKRSNTTKGKGTATDSFLPFDAIAGEVTSKPKIRPSKPSVAAGPSAADTSAEKQAMRPEASPMKHSKSDSVLVTNSYLNVQALEFKHSGVSDVQGESPSVSSLRKSFSTLNVNAPVFNRGGMDHQMGSIPMVTLTEADLGHGGGMAPPPGLGGQGSISQQENMASLNSWVQAGYNSQANNYGYSAAYQDFNSPYLAMNPAPHVGPDMRAAQLEYIPNTDIPYASNALSRPASRAASSYQPSNREAYPYNSYSNMSDSGIAAPAGPRLPPHTQRGGRVQRGPYVGAYSNWPSNPRHRPDHSAISMTTQGGYPPNYSEAWGVPQASRGGIFAGPGGEHEALDEIRNNLNFQPRNKSAVRPAAKIAGGSFPSGKISSILDRMQKRVDDIKVPGPYAHMGFDATVASPSRAAAGSNSSVTGLGSPIARGQAKGHLHFGCVLPAVTVTDIAATLSPFGELVTCEIDHTKTFAIVEFRAQVEYHRAMNSNPHKLAGQNVNVVALRTWPLPRFRKPASRGVSSTQGLTPQSGTIGTNAAFNPELPQCDGPSDVGFAEVALRNSGDDEEDGWARTSDGGR